jgi:hypothetical protein
MQLIQKLLKRTRPHSARNRFSRGLSTAELVGIIVIVGILGALGGTYVNGLVTQASTNAGNQNANTLNTTAASCFAGGATVGTAAGQLDTTSAATAIAALNLGVTVTNSGGNVLYKMTPPIANPGSYTMTGATTSNVVFSYTPGMSP